MAVRSVMRRRRRGRIRRIIRKMRMRRWRRRSVIRIRIRIRLLRGVSTNGLWGKEKLVTIEDNELTPLTIGAQIVCSICDKDKLHMSF